MEESDKSLWVLAGAVAALCGIMGFMYATSECEDARYSRGDVVNHRITGERAVIGSSFCSGGADSRKRMYEISTGQEEDHPRYWGQFEVE